MNQHQLTFDEYGYLTPYQPILTDLPTVERVFVQDFPHSTNRQPLFDRYLLYNSYLSKFLPTYMQWIGGSFVSRKLNPADIDVVTFVDDVLYEQHELAIAELKQWRLQRPKQIDGFFVRVYSQDHPLRNHSESDRIQWLFDWSRTNFYPRRKKGLIELTF